MCECVKCKHKCDYDDLIEIMDSKLGFTVELCPKCLSCDIVYYNK